MKRSNFILHFIWIEKKGYWRMRQGRGWQSFGKWISYDDVVWC